jgi:hypothetical protein
MRKGRHRRHQDARELKRAVPTPETSPEPMPEPCDECQRTPHASWCMADEDDE